MKEKIVEKYKIFENGEILNLKTNKKLKKILDKDGYITVRKFFGTNKLHRILAICFIPNPENKPLINHKNGIKNDNRLENLEWCTYSENTKHAFNLGLIKPIKGIKNKNSKKIYVFDREGKFLEEIYSLNSCAEKFNISKATISYQVVLKTINLNLIKTNYIFNYNKDIIFKRTSDIDKYKKIIYVYNKKAEIIDKLTSISFASKKYKMSNSTIKFQIKKNILSFKNNNQFYFSIKNDLKFL